MKLLLTVVATCALLASPVSVAHAGTADPGVTVAPDYALSGGDTVNVSATGITPDAAVRIVQCDSFAGDPEQDCPDLTSTTADGTGAVTVPVTLGDPVFRAEPFGDATPVYCRADGCHIFVVWTDQDGAQQVASSPALRFSGSPASIVARPSSGLADRQRIVVRGTAYGAQGRTVHIVEEACFGIIQGSGCYGALRVVTRRVHRNGKYYAVYPARRFLADGTDCAGDILGQCEMNVVVFDGHGQPDDSFGVSSRGQPAAFLTFAG